MRPNPFVCRILLMLSILQSGVPTPGMAGDSIFGGWGKKKGRPRTQLELLAESVDKLEEEIDEFGSITVKQPDIWGEARWTSHRQDYEDVLKKERDNFRFTLNAEISEADSAFALTAATLSAAAATGSGKAPSPPEINVSTVFSDSSFPQPTPLSLPSTTVVDPQTGKPVEGISVEPTVYLDQLSRYVQHLNHLRRINEGDDTSDAPGYALNLMRLPASILPGSKTRTGYGAEVNFTVTPELPEDLVVETFKDLTANDLIDQLGLPIVKLAEAKTWEITAADNALIEEEIARYERLSCFLKNLATKPQYALTAANLMEEMFCGCGVLQSDITSVKVVRLLNDKRRIAVCRINQEKAIAEFIKDLRNYECPISSYINNSSDIRPVGLLNVKDPAAVEEAVRQKAGAIGQISEQIANQVSQIAASTANNLDQVQRTISSSVELVASPRTREARYPVPPTQIACVFGADNLVCLARTLSDAQAVSREPEIHIFDAHTFLGEELEAAYQYLRALQEQACYDAWAELCPQISQAIRLLKFGRGTGELDRLRECFVQDCKERGKVANLSFGGSCPSLGSQPECDCKPEAKCDVCTTHALAWAILVESALLNDRLLDDMRRIEAAKYTHFLPDYPLTFYGPNPTPEAKMAFNTYVQTRWPIHTFALDPMVQEQNVSDAYARRRETQLALAVAFANGEIGANTFNRFSRTTDFQLETISLNRTVVGFANGNDTFGWRFYPRVQAPPTPGNFKAAWQTWVAGAPSRDDDLCKRQLEPGPRELLAVVIMPSFVPHVRVDVRSNWFELDDPEEKKFTTEDSVRMGHMIQHIHHCKEACLVEQNIYRPGDVMRVMRAVDQLESRLPLQDTLVQVPYENDLGGYQLFALGTRNLGPEVIGYYGAPGVNTEGDTRIFVVGRGFNVNFTKVIAGGDECDFDLLSRDVMAVTIKKGVSTTTIKSANGNGDDPLVDLHVATPYGVSGHLYLPVISQKKSNPSYSFSPGNAIGCLNYKDCIADAVCLSTPVKIERAGVDEKAGAATLSVSAVLGNGTERALSYDMQPLAGSIVQSTAFPLGVTFKKGVASIDEAAFQTMLKMFLNGNNKLLATEGAIGLRLNGVVQIEGEPAYPIANVLTITLQPQHPHACCPTTSYNSSGSCFQEMSLGNVFSGGPHLDAFAPLLAFPSNQESAPAVDSVEQPTAGSRAGQYTVMPLLPSPPRLEPKIRPQLKDWGYSIGQ